MQKLPHNYHVAVSGGPQGLVTVSAQDLPDLQTAPPPEFGGPGGHWSPEALLLAAVADCYVLSFRAVARASLSEWRLGCEVEGLLDKDGDGILRFLRITLRPRLTVPAGTDAERAEALLQKAKRICLISNSLNSEFLLETQLEFAEAA